MIIQEEVEVPHAQHAERHHDPPAFEEGGALREQAPALEGEEDGEGEGPAPEGQPHRRDVPPHGAPEDEVPRPEQRSAREQEVGVASHRRDPIAPVPRAGGPSAASAAWRPGSRRRRTTRGARPRHHR